MNQLWLLLKSLKSRWFKNKRALKAHLFGWQGLRLPHKGDMLIRCGDPKRKPQRVTHITARHDNIEYEDGYDCSIFHCAWEYPTSDELPSRRKRGVTNS